MATRRCWVKNATVAVDGGDPIPADACQLLTVDVDDSTTRFAATILFEHEISVATGKFNTTAKNAVEISRGPLLYTLPVPGTVQTVELNGSYVQQTDVNVDSSTPWWIALVDPNATAPVFEGFAAVNPGVPFDRDSPPATITVQAKVTQNCHNYAEKGDVPDSPVPAANVVAGDATAYSLVPIAHSHLRLTVLPVLGDDADDDDASV